MRGRKNKTKERQQEGDFFLGNIGTGGSKEKNLSSGGKRDLQGQLLLLCAGPLNNSALNCSAKVLKVFKGHHPALGSLGPLKESRNPQNGKTILRSCQRCRDHQIPSIGRCQRQ